MAPLSFSDDVDATLRRAAEERRPVLLFFGAAWDAHSATLERVTFRDPAVAAASARFLAARVDFTDETPAQEAMLKRFAVTGVPTVILFDGAGAEIERVWSAIPARALVTKLERVKE